MSLTTPPHVPPAPWASRVLAGALAAAALLLSAAAPARADNPYDAEQKRLAREALRAGRAAEGMLPLVELWGHWDRSTPEVTLAQLERLERSRRLSPARRAYVGALLARARLRQGEPEAAAQSIEELGYVTAWRVVGPFDNEGKAGFDREMPPEAARTEPVRLEASYSGKERPVQWRTWPERAQYGYVDFHTVMRPNDNVCAFAETFVTSEREQALQLWLGNGGAAKAWWNGELVLEDDAYRNADPDRHVAMVGAHEGPNRLLVKVCSASGGWGFYLRLADRRGGRARGVAADADAALEAEAGHAEVRLPDPPETPLSVLEARAEGEEPDAEALEDLARFLLYTGADDPAENRARQLAAQAAEREPTVERLALAAKLAEQRHEVMALVDQAAEIAPDDPRTVLMRAQVEQGGTTPEEALPILEEIPEGTLEHMEGALVRIDVLKSFDLPEAALEVAEAIHAEAPEGPFWIRELAEAARSAGHRDRMIALRRNVVDARYDDFASRRELIADALHRGETERLLRQTEVLHALATSTGELQYLARIYEALDREAEALEALRQAHELAPHDASALVAQGRLLLRMEQPEAAADSFRDALALRPQDAETRELLEQLSPRERPDEKWAVGAKELLARRVEGDGYPSTVLQELTVNTVYENGLGSTFRQVAVQIHDDEGARQWRTYSTQFDPNSQRVQVRLARVHRKGRTLEAIRSYQRQLGQPWYRIYYDTRAHVVVFPDLEPGDVVEIRYRIDDVAHRNMFADYYGDLHLLQGFTPTVREDYVLITPTERKIYFNEPELAGLEHEREEKGSKRVDHYWAQDVPAIVQEDGMPGMTEVAPYLHVSTYRTWEQIGDWYWGLIKDQLYADETIKDKVRELVEDAPDLRTKVENIHNWVVENTRYVALEFGIHGFKPYRMPQVVRRGFGDCKDKASLIYTMLEEAGIDAHIVLVRTRRNGRIEDLPASLAVFDHAIAYVPELELYLDGTAEHNGTTELPVQDQGVTVLHVWPEGSELTRTPVLPAERNHREREMTVRLARDGNAELAVSEIVRGPQAAGFRRTYEAEGTRQERFERSMRSMFPGLQLESVQFEQLSDLEEPVRFRWKAEVPRMARRDGDELTLPPAVVDDLLRGVARTATRRHPLDLGGKSSYVEEREVKLPPGTRTTQLPEGEEIESEFGRVSLVVEGNGRSARLRTEVLITQDRIAPDDYPRFRKWVEKADAMLRQRLTIEGADR